MVKILEEANQEVDRQLVEMLRMGGGGGKSRYGRGGGGRYQPYGGGRSSGSNNAPLGSRGGNGGGYSSSYGGGKSYGGNHGYKQGGW